MSLVPYVIEDTGRGERSMDIYSRLLKDRIVLIGTPIDDQVANAIIAQLIFLRAEDPKKAINLYINSPGGSVTAGLAIYDTLRFLGVDIHTYCLGQAASFAALLLSAGTKGKRHALPHSRIMIHQPIGGIGGTSADMHIQAQEILRLKQILAEILAENTGKTIEQVLLDSERDFYMDPIEAMNYGLIDEVVSSHVKETSEV
ncbi:MAG: ATP-dependent Clp protease proteolytic subunit [Chlamydiia bacterium]|nr:ATP-dependent Clp protease proteolytic subunit [Chlamydiia bacterium]MCH9616672.1 ATP-dependent Clp protease proteolytic subunit [Chlamydiia bacterium]MCH9629404.1 ATP-dependent Clp protease proteolytic subunit [Chlamydiia bacterium]